MYSFAIYACLVIPKLETKYPWYLDFVFYFMIIILRCFARIYSSLIFFLVFSIISYNFERFGFPKISMLDYVLNISDIIICLNNSYFNTYKPYRK